MLVFSKTTTKCFTSFKKGSLPQINEGGLSAKGRTRTYPATQPKAGKMVTSQNGREAQSTNLLWQILVFRESVAWHHSLWCDWLCVFFLFIKIIVHLTDQGTQWCTKECTTDPILQTNTHLQCARPCKHFLCYSPSFFKNSRHDLPHWFPGPFNVLWPDVRKDGAGGHLVCHMQKAQQRGGREAWCRSVSNSVPTDPVDDFPVAMWKV